MKTTLSMLFAILLFASCTNNESSKEESKKMKAKQSEQISELQSVAALKDGIVPEIVLEYRREYRSEDFLVNGNLGTYSFINTPEFYQTATVNRGAGQVAMLEKELDATLLNTQTDTDLGEMTLGDLITNEDARMQGVLVIHNGKIVLEEYPGMRELDKHSWFSASKQLVGLTTHILAEEGVIDLEQTVNHYLPEYDSDDWKRIKVKHLLHHMAGMDYVETNANFMDPEHALSQVTKYALASRYEDGGVSAFDLLKDVKSYIEPGVKYDYASPNTQILGFIIERVSGEKYEDVISERIWTQVGMESDGHYAMSAQGEPLSAGLFASRLRDMGRFALLYTPSWKEVADEQIVSDTYWEKVYDTTYADALKRGVETDKSKYFKDGQSHATYQWDLVFDDGDLFKAGRYGQGIYISPETNTVVVYFSSVYMNEVYFPGFARQLVQQNYR